MNMLRKSVFVIVLLAVQQTGAQITGPSGQGHVETEVSYSNGDVKLAATLLMPRGSGPFPAVVVIHGSGPSTRSNAWTSAYVNALVKRNVAVLYPDKRGSGKSTGNWTTASIQDLAGDAIAGVEMLRETPGIAKDNIGVAGFSQGGHVAPAAASRSTGIAFVISVSASVVPMMEQIMDEVEMSSERAGLSKAQIETVNDINRKGLFAARTGSGDQEYLDALVAAKSGELKGNPVVERFPTDLNHPLSSFIRSVGDFDPMPYWSNTKVPILFVFGGADTQIRIKKSLDRIDSVLGKSGHNYSVLLFRKNGHGVFREDLLDLMSRWIADKGVH